MKEAVTRTRENLAERIEEAVSFSKEIDRNTLDGLEATLIGADLGTTTHTSAPTVSGPPAIREGTVVAPMQGLLLKVPVKVGDHVDLGDVVCVLEAMKMQNDITATRSGTVTHVYVQQGDVVSPRDPLIHVE